MKVDEWVRTKVERMVGEMAVSRVLWKVETMEDA